MDFAKLIERKFDINGRVIYLTGEQRIARYTAGAKPLLGIELLRGINDALWHVQQLNEAIANMQGLLNTPEPPEA